MPTFSIEEEILRDVKAKYPEFPVAIGPGYEAGCLSVDVFCVPDEQVREIQDFIYELGEKIPEYLVLAHVVNIANTKEHYPEHFTLP